MLPAKKGPKYGKRSFTDEEEELICRFVEGPPKESVEVAAANCRTTVTTIRSILKRVRARREVEAQAAELARASSD
jgi:hypothetical protein